MLCDPIIALNPAVFSTKPEIPLPSILFHGFSAPLKVNTQQTIVQAFDAVAVATTPGTIDTIIQAYCLACINNMILKVNKPGTLNSWGISNSDTKFITPPTTTIAAINSAMTQEADSLSVGLDPLLKLELLLSWPKSIKIDGPTKQNLDATNASAIITQFHDGLLNQIAATTTPGYYYETITQQSIIARYRQIYEYVIGEINAQPTFSDKNNKLFQIALQGTAQGLAPPIIESPAIPVTKSIPSIAVTCSLLTVIPKGLAAPPAKIDTATLKVRADILASAKTPLSIFDTKPTTTAGLDAIVVEMQKQFNNIKMRSVGGDTFGRNVSTGLFSPTRSVQLFQYMTAEDFPYLMPYLEITPITSIGNVIPTFPTLKLRGEGFDFANSESSRYNLLGNDEPQLGLSELRIVYASEIGPMSTFQVEMKARIANPTKLEEEDSSIGQLLRLGTYLELKFGYQEDLVDRIVDRINALEPGKITEKEADELKASIKRVAHVQVSSVQIEGANPAIWEVSIKLIGQWSRAMEYGLFIGPNNDEVLRTIKVMYKQYEQALEKLSRKADAEATNPQATTSGDLIALRRQFDLYRQQLRNQIISSCAAGLKALELTPAAIQPQNTATAATKKGKDSKKAPKPTPPPPPSSQYTKYVGKDIFVNLMVVVHQFVLPSILYLVEEVSTGVPDSVLPVSGRKVSLQNIYLGLDEPISQVIMDEVSATIASKNEQAGILEKIKVPKHYNEVFVNLTLIKKWVDDLFSNGQVPTVRSMLQTFNEQILHSSRTYYEYPIVSAGQAAKDDLIASLPGPRPSIVIRPGEKVKTTGEWYIRLVDFEDVMYQLELYNRLYTQSQGKGPAAEKANDLFKKIFTNAADIKFGTNQTIVEEVKFSTQTADPVANMNVGLAAQRLYGGASSTVDDIKRMVISEQAWLPTRSYNSKQYLGPFVVRYAMSTVNFGTSVGLLDLEPKKPIKIDVAKQIDQMFYITAIEHVITPHRIRTNVTAMSNKHSTLPTALTSEPKK